MRFIFFFFTCRIHQHIATISDWFYRDKSQLGTWDSLTSSAFSYHTDRGEGANHAIIDVLDFATHVVPALKLSHSSSSPADSHPSRALRQALDVYEDAVVARSRPGVLASRRACLDAHAFSRLFGDAAAANPLSPLLSKREMMLQFDDESLELMDY